MIILPNTYVQVERPLIFLAGPIRSAPDWQSEAIRIILAKQPDIIIASPRREVPYDLQDKVLKGNNTYFQRQRTWERHYIAIADRTGAVMFWLPAEQTHNCQKVYAAMTRLELGQQMTKYKFDKTIRFCIGGQQTFPEINTIECDLELDAPDKEMMPTLEQTCEEAIKLAKG